MLHRYASAPPENREISHARQSRGGARLTEVRLHDADPPLLRGSGTVRARRVGWRFAAALRVDADRRTEGICDPIDGPFWWCWLLSGCRRRLPLRRCSLRKGSWFAVVGSIGV